jgi:hypothetical protein
MFTRSTRIMGTLLIVCLNTALAQSPPPLSFLAARAYGTGATPRSVAVGDFNGDGEPYLAVANLNDGTVSLLLGNGERLQAIIAEIPSCGGGKIQSSGPIVRR